MSRFEWRSEHDMDVLMMEYEHKLLLASMNRLYERNQVGAPHLELVSIMRDLEQSTIEHFQREEVYLASIGYGALPSHKRVHQQLLLELARHRASYARNAGRVPPRVFAFLKDWLAAHIAHGDGQYVGFAAMSERSLTTE